MERMKDVISKINKNKTKIYVSFYFVLIILLSRNTMISSCVIGFTKSIILSALATIPIFCIFIYRAVKQKLDWKQVAVVSPLILVIILSVIVKQDWQMYNFSVLFYIVASLSLASIINFRDLKKLYINLFFIWVIISLVVTYIAKPILIEMNIETLL